jgi:hypothetical protein
MYTIKKLKELIKEESMASKDYAKHGLKSLARDEAKHSFFLSMQLKKREVKK